jgi:hypothetical protein
MPAPLPSALAAALAAALSAQPGLPLQPPAAREEPPDPLRLLARLSLGEPSAGAVQAAAAAQAAEGVPDPAAGATRRRLAALLPRLTAEVRHDEQSYRVAGLQASGEVDYLRSSPGTTVALRATWELSDLLAGRGEPSTAAALAVARRRDEAVRRATALHFERQRLRALLGLRPPADPLERAVAELELDRVTADLDAATGGRLGLGARP